MIFRFPLRALVAATGACVAAAHAQQAPAVPQIPQAGQVTPRDQRENSHRLMHVNACGHRPDADDQERAALADGGVRLANYFRQLAWRQGATTAMAPDASYTVLFAAST